jgi:hypothetical protein
MMHIFPHVTSTFSVSEFTKEVKDNPLNFFFSLFKTCTLRSDTKRQGEKSLGSSRQKKNHKKQTKLKKRGKKKMSSTDAPMSSVPFFSAPMNVSTSSSSSSFQVGVNPPREKGTKKRTQRKQRCLEELDPQSIKHFTECYELDKRKKELWKDFRQIDSQLNTRYSELAPKHKDIDIIFPNGLGRFKFQPAVTPSATPHFLTTPNKLLKSTLHHFSLKTIFKNHPDAQSAAENYASEFLKFLFSYRVSNPKPVKPNAPAKVPKDGFKFTPPKNKKRKHPDASAQNSKRRKN